VTDPGASAPAKRVLLALPQDILEPLRTAFERNQWMVRGALTGQGAIDFVWQETFDALVTVVQLPDMRGDVLFLGASAVWPKLRDCSLFLMTEEANPDIMRMIGCPTVSATTPADEIVEKIETLLSEISS
jgi:DNA-binding NarL/FixJ family response regulator